MLRMSVGQVLSISAADQLNKEVLVKPVEICSIEAAHSKNEPRLKVPKVVMVGAWSGLNTHPPKLN